MEDRVKEFGDPAAPVVDWQAVQRGLPGGVDGIATVVGMMREEAPVLLAAIRDAAATSDAEGLALHAHKLRGAASHLHAPAVLDVTTRMMDLASNGRVDEAAAELPALEASLVRFLEELSHMEERLAGAERSRDG